MARKATAANRRITVQTVERALNIMEALADVKGEIGIVELSRLVNLHVSTVHRLLSSLMKRGYVSQNAQTGRYSLGSNVLRLCRAFHGQSDIRAQARPFLQSLMEESGETANLIVLDRDEAVYIDQVQSPHLVRMFAEIGRHVPLHSTGCGKVLLAYQKPEERARIMREKGLPANTPHTITSPDELEKELAKVRAQGYAIDNEEQEIGVRCVAAPVRDYTGQVVAAISLSGPTTRLSLERIKALAPLVVAACAKLSASLGYKADTDDISVKEPDLPQKAV